MFGNATASSLFELVSRSCRRLRKKRPQQAPFLCGVRRPSAGTLSVWCSEEKPERTDVQDTEGEATKHIRSSARSLSPIQSSRVSVTYMDRAAKRPGDSGWRARAERRVEGGCSGTHMRGVDQLLEASDPGGVWVYVCSSAINHDREYQTKSKITVPRAADSDYKGVNHGSWSER